MGVYRNCYGEEITLNKPVLTPSGYAEMPGSGPAGETCKSCRHLACRELAKRYYKCGLMRPVWTGGRGTDVLLRSPACRRWGAKRPQDA
jgi:hypothetical protein